MGSYAPVGPPNFDRPAYPMYSQQRNRFFSPDYVLAPSKFSDLPTDLYVHIYVKFLTTILRQAVSIFISVLNFFIMKKTQT